MRFRIKTCVGPDHDTTHDVRGYIEMNVKECPTGRCRMVRVLSHEEAKQKARAQALRDFVRMAVADLGHGEDNEILALALDEADKIWPVTKKVKP